MEERQEITAIVDDPNKRLSVRYWIIIFIICLTGTIFIFTGFFVLELSIYYIISPDGQMFGEQGLVLGIFTVIIASFLLLFGYPLLIYMYRKSMV